MYYYYTNTYGTFKNTFFPGAAPMQTALATCPAAAAAFCYT